METSRNWDMLCCRTMVSYLAEYHFYKSQLSPQFGFSNTRHIWKWFKESWRLKYTYGRDVVSYCQLRLNSRCRHPAPGQGLIPLQRLHVFAHSRDPHPAIKLWCQVPFTKSKTFFSNWNILYAVLFEKQYIKSRTFNDKNRWSIKKVMVLKKLLPHHATRGTYSPGDWRCDEAWREQTLVCHPVMCQQRLIYCIWELNVMATGCAN